jgi:hypothetical protein
MGSMTDAENWWWRIDKEAALQEWHKGSAAVGPSIVKEG